jgi:hypothetical protein
MDSLARSAYIIYIVHYVYVLWLQRAVMGVDAHAAVIFLIVFTATLFSWLTDQCLLVFPWLRRAVYPSRWVDYGFEPHNNGCN